MLTSIALIFIAGLIMGEIFKKMGLPSLLGMIISGIITGPHALGLIDSSVMDIAADLRQIALVIILTRAGLSLDISDLKRVGRPAVMMCFVPACFEIFGAALLGPWLLGLNINESLVLGSTLAAVSPAVIVPRMIKIMGEGYGKKNSIPQLILAGASVDDVFVIVLFTSFCTLAAGGAVSAISIAKVPVSIVTGIILGALSGFVLNEIFKRTNMRATVKLLVVVSVSFLMLEAEKQLASIVPVSGLIAIMSIGLTLNKINNDCAKELSKKYEKLWVGANIVLFTLVGAAVDLEYVKAAGIGAAILVVGALVFRMIGVYVCMIKTQLNVKERLFCMVSYTPKATVQAAIGAVPLSMGLACGDTVLTAAVLAILITAPFGAICVDKLYKKLLDK